MIKLAIGLTLLVHISLAQFDDIWSDIECWEEGWGKTSAGTCSPCPKGTHNVGDDCIKCPIGTFAMNEGSTWCTECDSWDRGIGRTAMTRDSGSTSREDCIDPSTLLSNFYQAEVGFKITVKGKELCNDGIADFLYETAAVMPWNGRFTSCNVSNENGVDFTTMSLKLRPDTWHAWEIYKLLNMLQVYLPVVNRYVKYAEKAAEGLKMLVRDLPDLEILGMDLNFDSMDFRGIGIAEFTPFFHGVCNEFYIGGEYMFCEHEEAVVGTNPQYPNNNYVQFTANGPYSFDCADNMNLTVRMMNFVEYSDTILDCVKENSCRVVYMDCQQDTSTREVTIWVNVLSQEANPISSSGESWSYNNGNMVLTFTIKKKVAGCYQGDGDIFALQRTSFRDTLESQSTLDCANLPKCGEGQFADENGLCSDCPYGSYATGGGKQACMPCGYWKITGFPASAHEDMCYKFWPDWEEQARGYWPYSAAGVLRFSVDIDASMRVCDMIDGMEELSDKCTGIYTADQLQRGPELSPQYNLQQFLCSYSVAIANFDLEQEICQDHQEWDANTLSNLFEEGDMEGALVNFYCHMSHTIQDIVNDQSTSCENNAASLIQMGTLYMKEPVDMTMASLAFPLIGGLNGLKYITASELPNVAQALMDRMGMGDFNEITGWAIANDLMMTVKGMIGGMRIDPTVEFDDPDTSQLFCEDSTDKVRRSCPDTCFVEEGECFLAEAGDSISCEHDPCNDCKKKFYYSGDSSREYPCKKCEFKAENLGWVAENGGHAFYSCSPGSVPANCDMKATCSQSEPGATPVPSYPTCLPESQCGWPSDVENGEYRPRDWRDNLLFADYYTDGCPYKMFDCDDGFRDNYSNARYGVNVLWCNPSQDPSVVGEATCERKEEPRGCDFPAFIEGGRQLRQYSGDDYTVYQCYPGFIMTPNEEVMRGAESSEGMKEAYMNYYHVAWCYEDRIYMPSCTRREEAMHCGLPAYIEGGRANNFYFPVDLQGREDANRQIIPREFSEDEMEMMKKVMAEHPGSSDRSNMPFMARYECDDGKMMAHTMMGEMGWCRKDRSFELPQCIDQNEYQTIEFRFVHSAEMGLVGDDGKAFGGVVQTRTVDMRGNPVYQDRGMGGGEWEYNCNDGFNDNAAGAICRQHGFRFGNMIPVAKRMAKSARDSDGRPMHQRFAWTGFSCKYDDTLVMSPSCMAMPYQDALRMHGLRAACNSYDWASVRCYNDGAGSVARVSIKGKKIMCMPKNMKEGKKFDLRGFNLEAKFYLDDVELNVRTRYKRKKGFMGKYQLPADYKCLRCMVVSADMPDMSLAEGEYCVDRDE